MSSVASKAMGLGNRFASWLYVRSRGRLGGSARGVPVLVLTIAGRNTGKLRSVPVAYFEHDHGYLVAATAGGSKTDPQWMRNLRAANDAVIQVGETRRHADIRIPDANERRHLWQDVVLKRAPAFARYEEKSGRLIPIAVLTPRA